MLRYVFCFLHFQLETSFLQFFDGNCDSSINRMSWRVQP